MTACDPEQPFVFSRYEGRYRDGLEFKELLRYRPEEFPVAVLRIAKSLGQPRGTLIKQYRDQKDLLAGLDVGLMAILLQVRAEREPPIDNETLELAEICSAKLRNLVLANDNWISDQEWESVGTYFSKLREKLMDFDDQ